MQERMILGSFVEARIPGRELEDVVRLNRDYIRQDDTDWIMEDDSLRIRQPDIVFEDGEFAYLRGGVEGGDHNIITTSLSTAREGGGSISIELVIGTDRMKTYQDIDQAVNRIRTFPDNIEEPEVRLQSN